jgi:hypothetical protein
MIEIAFPAGARLPVCSALIVGWRGAGARMWGASAYPSQEAMMTNDNDDAPRLARRIAQPARKRLIARLWHNAERQVEEIESRFGEAEGAALEQSAKALAVLTRAVRDLVAIDQDMKPGKAEIDAARALEEPPARAVEQFRQELADKLASLLGERQGGGTAQAADSPGA